MSAKSHSGLPMRAALLSVSLIIGSQTAISPALPAMVEQFSDQSRNAVESLTTIQCLPIILMVMASALLAERFGKKRVVAFGVALSAIAGTVPLVCQDYPVILVSRLVFGVGIGCLNGLAVSLVGDFFEGQERATLMGVRSSMETLSTAVLSALVGVLVAFGWRWAFSIYLIGVPILAAFVLLVPDPPAPAREATDASGEKAGHALNAEVVGLAIFSGLICMVANGFVIRVPSIVEGQVMGTAVEASLVVSATTVSGTVAGIAYGSLHRLLGRHVVTLACVLMVAGTFLCYVADSVLALGVAGVLLDFAWPLVISHVMNMVPERCADGAATLSTAFVVAATATTSLFAPTALNVIGAVMGSASLAAPFAAYAVMTACLGVWWVVRLG